MALYKLLQQSEMSLQQQDLEKALTLVGKARRFAGSRVECDLLLSRIHGRSGEFGRVVDCLDSTLDAVPLGQRAQIALRAGLATERLYDRSIAERYFRLAAMYGPAGEAPLALAEHLSRIRKGEEARELVNNLLFESKQNPRLLLLWAKLNRREPGYEKRLIEVSESQVPRLCILANYELARHYDLEGDFDFAFEYLGRAKELSKAQGRKLLESRRLIRGRLLEAAKACDESQLREWGRQKFEPLGDCQQFVLLAGHPRSGTTLVEQILDFHDQIISVEESDNFSWSAFTPAMKLSMKKSWLFESLKNLKHSAIANARDRYIQAMARYAGESLRGRVLIDKNPSLTALIPSMLRFLPEMKVVVMLRDPRDVVLSCFMQPFNPLNEITSSYLSLKDTASEYADVMGVYLALRDILGDAIHELRYEDLVSEPERNAQGLFSFLNVDWKADVMNFHERSKGKVVRSPTADAVTEGIHNRALERWRHYKEYFEPALEVLEPSLEALEYGK